jgi:hypothetical protein
MACGACTTNVGSCSMTITFNLTFEAVCLKVMIIIATAIVTITQPGSKAVNASMFQLDCASESPVRLGDWVMAPISVFLQVVTIREVWSSIAYILLPSPSGCGKYFKLKEKMLPFFTNLHLG